MKTQRRALAWGAVIPVALAVACAGPQRAWERPVPAAELAVAMADKPAVLAPYVETLLAQGPRNAVLNHGRIGFLAFELGRPRLAQAQLENAAQAIETVYADNPAAELARSNFAREDVKDFKGEPFERAMVFYYLGLSYLALGDFENARASFKAGEYQDSLSRAEKYQADFALLNFLAGWAAHCAGRPAAAADSFAAAARYRPGLTAPAPGANRLTLFEAGGGPIKWAAGAHRQLLKVRAGLAPRLPAPAAPLVKAADLYHQASTRGGRAVDAVLAGKAVFKEGMLAVGGAMVDLGLAVAHTVKDKDDDTAALIGLGFIVSGVAAAIAGAAARPAADVRALDVLPHSIFLATDRTDGAAAPRSVPGAAVQRVHDGGACRLVWARDRKLAGQLPARASASVAAAGAAGARGRQNK